jgi:hypothetical protein
LAKAEARVARPTLGLACRLAASRYFSLAPEIPEGWIASITGEPQHFTTFHTNEHE